MRPSRQQGKPLHSIFWRLMVLVFLLLNLRKIYTAVMSWAKESADAGVAGLSEWEVVRGVMQGEVDVDLPNVPETAFVKAEPGEDEGMD